ncbi:MAG: MBOAT family protein [Clostridia bacterium]|nr:MBOAT family protein [Clostridia bacterium]
MTFNSWEFLLFYPIVALLYFVLPKKLKWPMLLVASYYFYMCYQAKLVFLIAGTTLISWVASMIIERAKKPSVRKIWLAVTLIVCLGVLFFYKYFNFLSGSVTGLIALFGGSPDPLMLNLILPVGISFYTFQTLSYVIDVYRGEVKTEKNFFFYALFVSFFPQLVAGPIERPDNLIPQLREIHKWDNDNAIKGAKHMIVGFIKKVVVADGISIYVDAVYNNVGKAGIASSAPAVLIATILFAVQIYCDFSGYTDIAIGCARIMGIRLMKNFDHPYTATSIKEFWDRWHISLSSWLHDYLYRPVGKNSKGARRLFAIMVVFLASGLWHGAAWTYVIWGAIHGIFRVMGQITWKPRNKLLGKLGVKPTNPVLVWIRRLNTFILVDFAWIFFRANTTGDAFTLIKTIFTGWSMSVPDAVNGLVSQVNADLSLDAEAAIPTLIAILTCVLSVLILLMVDRMLTYDDSVDGSDYLVRNGAFVYYVLIILFCWGLLLSRNMASTFIYFQF